MNPIKVMLGLAMLILGMATFPSVADTNSYPPELRAGQFSCGQSTIQSAIDLKHAGWTYIMPQPKSRQAAWGNTDGRTTWWVGYWINGKSNASSSTQPTKDSSGQWNGDGLGGQAWRRGGTPAAPTKIEWLCSAYGGIPPD